MMLSIFDASTLSQVLIERIDIELASEMHNPVEIGIVNPLTSNAMKSLLHVF